MDFASVSIALTTVVGAVILATLVTAIIYAIDKSRE